MTGEIKQIIITIDEDRNVTPEYIGHSVIKELNDLQSTGWIIKKVEIIIDTIKVR